MHIHFCLTSVTADIIALRQSILGDHDLYKHQQSVGVMKGTGINH